METPPIGTVTKRLSIERNAERIDDPTQQARTNRNSERGPPHPHRIAVRYALEFSKRHQQRPVFSESNDLYLGIANVSYRTHSNPWELRLNNCPDNLKYPANLTHLRCTPNVVLQLI
jgi:hypothetical protein